MKNYLCFFILQVYCCAMLAQSDTQKWLTVADTQKSADALVESRKTAWGLGEKDALVRPNETPKTDKFGLKHYPFYQTYKGVPIEGAEWLVHEKNGLAKTANGILVSGLELSTVPTLSEEQALQYALNVVNAEIWAWEDEFLETMLREDTQNDEATYYPTGELMIVSPDLIKGYATAESYRLAYKFDVFAAQPLAQEEIYIDAHNGEVVTSFSLFCHNDVAATGDAAYSCDNPVNITVSDDGSYYILSQNDGRKIHVRTADNTDSTPNIDVTSDDTFFDEDPTATAVYYAAEKFYDYLLYVHGRNSIDGDGLTLKAWVHYQIDEEIGWNNAVWAGNFALFGDGDNIKYAPLTSIDIVAHEFAHGLTQHTAELKYFYESGALNEGFSDIFGTLVEFYAEPACADWLIGEDVVVQNGKTASRNMSNPKDATALNQQPNTYKGEYWHFGWQDHGGVHTNSGVLNYWFYLIVNGGSGTNDNDFPYSVATLDNNANVARSKAADIAFLSLTEYLNKFAQYADARAATIDAAIAIYGENSSEVQTVVSAWCAVGVGECEINTNTITLVTPNGGEVWQSGTSKVINWISTGDITQVNIALSINGGASWQTLATATNNDGFHIYQVPNVASTQVLIRIADSNNAITNDVSNAVFTINACDVVSAFESSATEVCENESVGFTNNTINAATSEWRINGSLESSNTNFNYLFTQAGTYIVSLRSINGNCIDEYTEIITVYAAANASFTYAKTDMTINCHAESADATDSYTWTVDNVSVGSSASLEYAFADEGTYYVCLSVNDECGFDEECNLITVNEAMNCGSGEESWRHYLNGDNIQALLEVGNYIYVGTNGGLVKINQINGAKVFFNTPNLPNNYISCLLESSSGEIFVGTSNGLAKFDGNSSTGWTIYDTSNSNLPHNNISCLLESSSGEIFVGTYGFSGKGLAKFDGNSSTGWTIYDTSNSNLPHNNISCLLESSSGEIFVGTYGGLAKFDGSSSTNWVIYNTSNSNLPHNNIRCLLESSSDDIIVSYGGGLAKFDGNSSTGWTIYNTSNLNLPSNNFHALLESNNGDIFVGTDGGGLAKFDGNSNTGWTIYDVSNTNLSNNYVYSLLESNNGDIFVGTYGGLAKFDGNSSIDWITVNTSNSDLPDNGIYSLLESSNGEIFVGTDGGGLAKFDGNSSTGWTIYDTSNSNLPHNNVSCLLESSSDDIFVGTNNGLAKFDGNSSTDWITVNTSNSDLPNNDVRCLLKNSSGNIFVGTYGNGLTEGGGLAKFDGNSSTGWTIFNKDNSDLPSDKVYCLLESSDGDIFVGTNNGLAKFDGISTTGWTIYRTTNSDLPNKTIYVLLESSNGDIFVGTNNGLAKFDGISTTGWTIFNTSNSDLPDNGIYSLLESSNGEIFVGTDGGGLAKFDGNISTNGVIYNVSNSVVYTYIRALLENSSGEIFIGTVGGLSVLAPPSLTVSFNVPANTICTTAEHIFTNNSIGTTYEWHINGNLTSTQTDLTHTFTQAGEYTITLKAFDSEGCEDTYSQNITVYNEASNVELGTNISECDVSSLEITANLTDMQSYEWQSNNTTVGTTASLIATESGTYTLLVTDMCGNSYSDSIDILVGSECVWPGDFNYDQIVNNQDILYLGLGFGESGFERPNASFNWEGQACQDWDIWQENNVNYKHLDADGSGTIDANDAQAIEINYAKTHDSYTSTFNDNESHITLDAEVISGNTFEPDATSTTIVIGLFVNEEDAQQIATYGFALDVEYYLPPIFGTITNITVVYDESFVGSTSELLTIYKHIAAQNKVEIGLSRYDRSNVIGAGKIADVIVEVDIEVIGTETLSLDVDVSNVKLSLSDNTFLPVGSSQNTFTFTSETPNDTCGTPTNLHESGLTCSSITLNWDAMPNAEAYILAGRKAGGQVKVFPETQNTSRTFTGSLQTNTTYDWSVKTKCNGVWTEYPAIESFTTPSCKNSTYDETKDPFFVNENESLFSEISLYPNPAKNDLHISFTSFEEENISIKVFDILGKMVLTKDIEVLQGENRFDLNIASLQSGSYFLQIGENVEKFIVF